MKFPLCDEHGQLRIGGVCAAEYDISEGIYTWHDLIMVQSIDVVFSIFIMPRKKVFAYLVDPLYSYKIDEVNTEITG